MASFDPDAYLAARAPGRGGSFDPDAFLAGQSKGQEDQRPWYKAAYQDIPSEIYNAGAQALETMNAGLNPFSEEGRKLAADAKSGGPKAVEAGARNVADTARGVAAIPQLALSPATGVVRSVGGHALNALNKLLDPVERASAVAIFGEEAVRKAEARLGHPLGHGEGQLTYESAKNDVDQLSMGIGPRVGAPATAAAAAARLPKTPPPVPPARVLDVTLSEGQATRDLSKIQREQAALRNNSGPPAQAAAQEFANQQAAEVASTRDRLIRGLNPMNVRLAETPQQAGELVQQGVQGAARAAKADVDAAYKAANQMPGEIHADVFRSMPQDIKTALSAGDEPVIIDEKTTPIAAQMIGDIERRVGSLKIENRADPFGHPKPTTETRTILSGPGYHIAEDVAVPPNIVGISLRGVEQVRKRLSTMRGDAMGGTNAADARAARAVLKAFDERIDAAVNAGQFTGDVRAVNAWKTARAKHADYRGTFREGNNDPVGRVIERIVGADTAPERLPGNVADYLGGASASGVDGHLNAAVARRIQSILGAGSEQWSAVKQGLLSRLLERPPGVDDYGPRQIANRIGEFLNGRGRPVAEAVYSPAERQLIERYAKLMRHLEVPQAGANWSNTAAFAGRTFTPSLSGRVLSAIGERVGMVVHGLLGRTAGTAVEIATRHVSEANAQKREAREIARMMPVIANVAANYAKWAQAAQRSPNGRNISRLMLAARNLSSNLDSIGITFSPNDLLAGLQGPQPAQGRDTGQQPKQQ